MPTMLGSVVNAVLVHGLGLFEALWPMPERLAEPLPQAPLQLRRRRDPVVLVGGYANSPRGWNEWKRSLEADGFEVFVLDNPSRGLGDMYESARRLAAFVDEVRRRTGSAKVDLVGFSEGGLLARMYVAHFQGAGTVDRIVTLATPHNGVRLNGLVDAIRAIPLLGAALPESSAQLMRGSELIRTLDRLDAPLRARGPVRYASIYAAHFDGMVTSAAARLDGGTNIPLSGKAPFRGWLAPNHFSIYHLSHDAYRAARSLLLDEDAIPAPVRDARSGASAARARRATGPGAR